MTAKKSFSKYEGGTALPANLNPTESLMKGVSVGKPFADRHSEGIGLRSCIQPAGSVLRGIFAHVQKACLTGHMALNLGQRIRPALPEARTVGNRPEGCQTLAGKAGLPSLSLPYL